MLLHPLLAHLDGLLRGLSELDVGLGRYPAGTSELGESRRTGRGWDDRSSARRRRGGVLKGKDLGPVIVAVQVGANLIRVRGLPFPGGSRFACTGAESPGRLLRGSSDRQHDDE